jgi:hypothetical protein
MISMKLSKAEAKSMLGDCCPSDGSDGSEGPKYPYGLTISLNDEVMQKLGITEVPAIGAKLKLMAEVEVISTSQYARQEGTDKDVSLQITSMELDTGAKAKPTMYPNSKMS